MYNKHLNGWYGFRLPNYHPDDLGELHIGEADEETNEDETEEENKDDDTEEKEGDDDKDDSDEGDETEEGDKDEDTDEEEDKEGDDKDDKEDDELEDDEDKTRYTAFKDIKAKYPDFFKEFPDVRGALVREAKYSEYFGSPDEAQNAIKQANALQAIEEDILVKHDPRGLIDTIAKAEGAALDSVILNILPYLQEKHKDLYYDVAAVPIKQLLRNAWSEGKGKETDLGKAAAILHKHFFNNYDINEKVKGEGAKPQEKTTREVELEQRLTKIEEGKTSDFVAACDQSYTTRISRIIEERVNQDERLTPYLRGKVIEDVMRDIRSQLEKDNRYRSTMRSLLNQAKASGYTSDFKSRVISTALARAKSLIAEVTKRKISEATKTKGTNTTNRDGKKLKFKPRGDKQRQEIKQSTKAKSDIDILKGA